MYKCHKKRSHPFFNDQFWIIIIPTPTYFSSHQVNPTHLIVIIIISLVLNKNGYLNMFCIGQIEEKTKGEKKKMEQQKQKNKWNMFTKSIFWRSTSILMPTFMTTHFFSAQ